MKIINQKPNNAGYNGGGSKLVHQAMGTKDNEWGTHLPHEPTRDGQHEEDLQLPKRAGFGHLEQAARGRESQAGAH